MQHGQSGNAATVSAGSKRWILAATIIGSSMAYIDGTVVNVAMPVLQNDFGARLDQVQWVVEAYTLLIASLVLVGGTLGDRFGRRRVYAMGVALYAVASGWCGLAPNLDQLIAARALQGLGGALLVPGSLAIITSCFVGTERGAAIGTWSGLSAVSTAIGPLLGGWLVDNLSWRAVFYINIPMAAVVLLILARHVPESRDEEAPHRLDWPGVFSVTVGLALLVYGLIEANSRGLGSPAVLASIGGGIALLIAFVAIEARSRVPMMRLTLFRSRNFSGANLLTLLLYAGLNGMFFFLGFNLLQVQHYSATATGAALLPFIVLISTLSRFSGSLSARFGPRPLLVAGPLVAAIGFVLLGRTGVGGSYWATFFPGIAVVGLGMAITVAPLTSTVMNSVSAHQAGVASGVNNAVSWLSSLLAIALLGLIAVGAFGGNLRDRLATVDLPPATRTAIELQSPKLAAVEIPATLAAGRIAEVRAAVDQAFVETYSLVMNICAGLAVGSALFAALVIERKQQPVGSPAA